MSDQFNCPNCGAPISGDICPYCGTAFLDWSTLDEGKANWIKIKLHGRVDLIKASIQSVTFKFTEPEPTCLYGNNRKYLTIGPAQELQLHIDLSAHEFDLPGYGKTLMLQIDPEVADLRQVSDILKGAKQNE